MNHKFEQEHNKNEKEKKRVYIYIYIYVYIILVFDDLLKQKKTTTKNTQSKKQ